MESNLDDAEVTGRVTRARRKRLESDGEASSRPSTPLATQVKMDPIPENTPTKRMTRRQSVTNTPKNTPLTKTPSKNASSAVEIGEGTPSRSTRRRSISSAVAYKKTPLNTLSEEEAKNNKEASTPNTLKVHRQHLDKKGENGEKQPNKIQEKKLLFLAEVEDEIIEITDTDDQESNEGSQEINEHVQEYLKSEHISPKPTRESQPESLGTVTAKISPNSSVPAEQGKSLHMKSVKFENSENPEVSKAVYQKTPASFKKKFVDSNYGKLNLNRKMSMNLVDSVLFVESKSTPQKMPPTIASECSTPVNDETNTDACSDTLVIDLSPEKFLRSGKNYGEISPSSSSVNTSEDSEIPQHSPRNAQKTNQTVELMEKESEVRKNPLNLRNDPVNKSLNTSEEMENSSIGVKIANVEHEQINNNNSKYSAETSHNTSIDISEKSLANKSTNNTHIEKLTPSESSMENDSNTATAVAPKDRISSNVTVETDPKSLKNIMNEVSQPKLEIEKPSEIQKSINSEENIIEAVSITSTHLNGQMPVGKAATAVLQNVPEYVIMNETDITKSPSYLVPKKSILSETFEPAPLFKEINSDAIEDSCHKKTNNIVPVVSMNTQENSVKETSKMTMETEIFSLKENITPQSFPPPLALKDNKAFNSKSNSDSTSAFNVSQTEKDVESFSLKDNFLSEASKSASPLKSHDLYSSNSGTPWSTTKSKEVSNFTQMVGLTSAKKSDLPNDSKLASPIKDKESYGYICDNIIKSAKKISTVALTSASTIEPKKTINITEIVEPLPRNNVLPDVLKSISSSKNDITMSSTEKIPTMTSTCSTDAQSKTTNIIKLVPLEESISLDTSKSNSMEKISSTTLLVSHSNIEKAKSMQTNNNNNTLPEISKSSSPLKCLNVDNADAPMKFENSAHTKDKSTELLIDVSMSTAEVEDNAVAEALQQQVSVEKANELDGCSLNHINMENKTSVESIEGSKSQVFTLDNRRHSAVCVTTTVEFEGKTISPAKDNQFEEKRVGNNEDESSAVANVQSASSREVTSSWTYSVQSQSDKIDSITTSSRISAKATKPLPIGKQLKRVSVGSIEGSPDYQMNVETDEGDEERDNENPLVNNEAVDAGIDYESGDSMNFEERELYAENHSDLERGESIGSEDTIEDEEVYAEESDSFIAPSGEESVVSAKFSEEENLIEEAPKEYKRLIFMASDSDEDDVLQKSANRNIIKKTEQEAGISALETGDVNIEISANDQNHDNCSSSPLTFEQIISTISENDEVVQTLSSSNKENNRSSDASKTSIELPAADDITSNSSDCTSLDKTCISLELSNNSIVGQTTKQIHEVPNVPKSQSNEEKTNETLKSSKFEGETSLDSSSSSMLNSSANDSNIENELRDLIEAAVLDGPMLKQSRRQTMEMTTEALKEKVTKANRRSLRKSENSKDELSQSFVDFLKERNCNDKQRLAGKRKISQSFTSEQQTIKKAKHDITLEAFNAFPLKGMEPEGIEHILQRCDEILNESSQQKLLSKKQNRANMKKKNVAKMLSDDTQFEEKITISPEKSKKHSALKCALEASNKILTTKLSRNAQKGKTFEYNKATIQTKPLKNTLSKDNEPDMEAVEAKKYDALKRALTASHNILSSKRPLKARKAETIGIAPDNPTRKFESKKLSRDFLESLESTSHAPIRKRKRGDDIKVKVFETKTGIVTETKMKSPTPKINKHVEVFKMKTGPVFVELASPIRVKKSRSGFEESPASPINPGWKVDMINNEKHRWLQNKAGIFKVEKIRNVEIASGNQELASDAAERARNFLKSALNRNNVKRENACHVLRSKKYIQ